MKTAISHEYATKLENHKNELVTELERQKLRLQTEANLDIERAKTSLGLESKKEELQFSRMHERRAEAIARIFDDLSSLCEAMREYTQAFEYTGITPRAERREAATAAYLKFHNYFVGHSIFLPKTTGDQVRAIDDEIRKLYNRFAMTVDKPPSAIQMVDTTGTWIEISDALDTKIRAALSSIEDEFRRLIGGTDS